MKSIFLSDSDEEAIMEIVKQHKELYDRTTDNFKDKQKKERLWEQLAATRNLPIKTVQEWFETQHTRYGKLTQTKSGQAAEKSTECQTWLKDRPLDVPQQEEVSPGPSGSGGGSPKAPFSILLFSLLRLKICASDDDPLAPALTHRNLQSVSTKAKSNREK